MAQQAQSGLFTDWYPPMLTWLWSVLPDNGPLLPFLLQAQIYWIGIVLLTVGLQPAAGWTRFLPLMMLLNPASWLVVVVDRDGAVVALLAAAMGVASLALRAVRSGRPDRVQTAFLVAAVIVGFATAARGYALPLGLLLLLALTSAILPRRHVAGLRVRVVLSAGAVAVVSALMVTLSLPATLIGNVQDSRADEAFYALDAYHIDCSAAWSGGGASAALVSPAELWRGGVAPCADGGPGSYGQAWTGPDDPTGEQLLGLGDWLGMLGEHPVLVVGGRVQHAAALAGEPFPWTPLVDGGELVAAPGAAAAGAEGGSPNRGGVVLAAHAAATSFMPQQLIVWVTLVPVVVGLWVRRRAAQRGKELRTWPVRVWPLLLWPTAAAATAGVLAASNDATLVAPAALLGWALSLWVLGADSIHGSPPPFHITTAQRPYPAGRRHEAPVAPNSSGGQPRPVQDAVHPGRPAASRRRRVPAFVRGPVAAVRRVLARRPRASDSGPAPRPTAGASAGSLSAFVAQQEAGQHEGAQTRAGESGAGLPDDARGEARAEEFAGM